MAGFPKPTLRDIPVSDDTNDFQSMVNNLDETKKGDVDPSKPKHAQLVNTVLSAISSGALDDNGARKLMRMNVKFAPAIAVALAQRNAMSQAHGVLKENFQPAGMNPNIGMDYELVPPKNDYETAITKLNQIGAVDEANKLATQYKKMQEHPGSDSPYGGIQTGWDPVKKKYVQYTFDKQSHKPIALESPPGVQPTVSMQAQVIQGANGPEVAQIPGRGVPGTSPTITQTGVSPSRENDIQEFGQKVDKAGLTRSLPVVAVIDKGISTYDKTGELPGVGNLKNMSAAKYLKTPEGRQMSAAVQMLFNEDVLRLSGTAATETETERNKVANALTAANTADDYVKIYKSLIRPKLRTAVQNLRSSYGDAADLYEKRSKLGLKAFAETDPFATTAAPPSDDRARLQEAIRRKLRGGQ